MIKSVTLFHSLTVHRAPPPPDKGAFDTRDSLNHWLCHSQPATPTRH